MFWRNILPPSSWLVFSKTVLCPWKGQLFLTIQFSFFYKKTLCATEKGCFSTYCSHWPRLGLISSTHPVGLRDHLPFSQPILPVHFITLHISTLKMEASYSSETSGSLQTTWCYSPKHNTHHSHQYENLKSYVWIIRNISHSTQTAHYVTEMNHIMLFREVMAICTENHMKQPINTLFGQMKSFLY
jgi:hypothetical protein